MPLGWEKGAALPLPDGADPHISRGCSGKPETAAMRTDAVMILVKDCIVKDVRGGSTLEMTMLTEMKVERRRQSC